MALRDAGLPPLPRTAWLAIDLDRLAANLAAVRSMLPPGVRLEPVVKADAYGHGAVGVASFLGETGVDGLSVATLDEARELRAAGVTLPLLVLFSIAPELAAEAARLDVAITIADRVLLEERDIERNPGTRAIHRHLRPGIGRQRSRSNAQSASTSLTSSCASFSSRVCTGSASSCAMAMAEASCSCAFPISRSATSIVQVQLTPSG